VPASHFAASRSSLTFEVTFFAPRPMTSLQDPGIGDLEVTNSGPTSASSLNEIRIARIASCTQLLAIEKVQERSLVVRGLDALDNTPVLDIKPDVLLERATRRVAGGEVEYRTRRVLLLGRVNKFVHHGREFATFFFLHE